jgi:hypothetical protein
VTFDHRPVTGAATTGEGLPTPEDPERGAFRPGVVDRGLDRTSGRIAELLKQQGIVGRTLL